MKKNAHTLWIIAGLLFMLPSILGNGREELIPIGIAFIVIGIATQRKNKPPQTK